MGIRISIWFWVCGALVALWASGCVPEQRSASTAANIEYQQNAAFGTIQVSEYSPLLRFDATTGKMVEQGFLSSTNARVCDVDLQVPVGEATFCEIMVYGNEELLNPAIWYATKAELENISQEKQSIEAELQSDGISEQREESLVRKLPGLNMRIIELWNEVYGGKYQYNLVQITDEAPFYFTTTSQPLGFLVDRRFDLVPVGAPEDPQFSGTQEDGANSATVRQWLSRVSRAYTTCACPLYNFDENFRLKRNNNDALELGAVAVIFLGDYAQIHTPDGGVQYMSQFCVEAPACNALAEDDGTDDSIWDIWREE